jgi:hypothetical protein
MSVFSDRSHTDPFTVVAEAVGEQWRLEPQALWRLVGSLVGISHDDLVPTSPVIGPSK